MKYLARLLGGVSFLALSLVVAVSGQAQQSVSPRPAVPVDPIVAIMDALRSHSIVALGEGDYGNEQGHAFRLSLIRDPRFANSVNDIVVEFGNALHQDIMDRFVQGDEVSDAALREVWRNTTGPGIGWDRPIYEEFFRAVRAVNVSLPRERQLRVLLGDPPIDWNAVRTPEDHFKWIAQRDTYPTDLIRREVLAKNRHALIIYGDMHLQRKNLVSNYEALNEISVQTIVEQLSKSATPVFTIWTNTYADLATRQADVASWRVPSLALVRGTLLGATDFAFYYPFTTMGRMTFRDGQFAPIPRDQWRTFPMEDQFDAVLYLGPPSAITHSRLRPTFCSDAEYLKMLMGRLTLVGPPPEAERLKQACPAQIPN